MYPENKHPYPRKNIISICVIVLLLASIIFICLNIRFHKFPKEEVTMQDPTYEITFFNFKYQFLETGQLYEIGKVRNGKKDGLWKHYSRGAKPWEVCEKGYYVNGKEEGKWIFYRADGECHCFFSNGKRNGVSLEFEKNGKLASKMFYKNGKLNGHAIYYENGKPIMEGDWKDGKEHGVWIIYKDVIDGKRYKEFYDNGKLCN